MGRIQSPTILMLGFLAVFTVHALEKCDSKTFTYTWDVSVDQFDHMSYLYSPPFSSWNGTVEEPWQLQFYPHGKASVSKGCLAVFFVHRKLHHVQMDYQLLLINQKDENKTVVVDKKSTFENSDDGWGPGPCIDNENLNSPPSSGIYAPEKGFVVNGKIKIVARIPTDPIPIQKEEPTTTSFTWDMNLDSLKIQNGDNLLSPKFKTQNGGRENMWQIQVYPNGVDSEQDGFFSMFLVHRGKGNITIYFEITLVNEKPENSRRYVMEDTFSHDLHGWGEREVIERKALTKENGFVFGNNIKIQVRVPMDSISVHKLKEGQAIVPFLWEVPLSEMTAEPGDYMLSPKFTTWDASESETWQLQLYPSGLNAKNKQFISAYLVHRGAKKVDYSFELYISNKKEEDTATIQMENVKFKYDLHGWGGNTIVKRSVLEDPEKGFLFDGNIKLGVRIATDHIPLKKTESIMVPYTWEVKVKDLELETGKYILSPNITTWRGKVRETWHVQLYPNGLSSKDNDYASLFIAHRGDNEVKSRWSVSIINKDSRSTESRAGTNTFGYDLQGWGSRTFIKSAKLRDASEGFIFNDKIKIGVELPSDNITLSIDNDCPVIKEAPVCETCPKVTPVGNPVFNQPLAQPAATTAQPASSPYPTSAPINASLHNLYRELKLKMPDGTEFSINHIMSFESIEKLISNLMSLNSKSSNYNQQPPVREYKRID